jgi:glycosyltransferase involved in cell wall biosynthesis
MDPKVSFIVPCYNLGHLLSECVNSILTQTYGNLELLIMDDCSPDQTPEVAQSIRDPRIRYLRNQENLGNIGNYNKGINLARGQYVWLISADDRLRRDYILARYVQLMDDHPEVGYVFCPAVAVQDNHETGLMTFTSPTSRDTIFKGLDFLQKLIDGNCVSAPAAMVRKKCYERVSLFPSDMPYAGDWYLWCMFAFHYDVAYFAEPMVNRRLHARNLSKFFMTEGLRTYVANMIEVPWHIKDKTEAAGYKSIAGKCKDAIVAEYVSEILAKQAQDQGPGLTLEEFEQCLRRHTRSRREESEIRARVHAGLGDHYCWQHDVAQAARHYAWAVREDPCMLSVYAKYALLHLGKIGVQLRARMGTMQRLAKAMKPS